MDGACIEVDLQRVVDYALAGKAHPVLLERGRITDTILSELESVDPEFASWLGGIRQIYLARIVGSLEKALPGEDSNEIKSIAESIARAILLLEPAHETSARLIIRSRWATGDVGTAFRTYDELWRHLDKEFEIKPSLETQDLIARLRMEQPDTAALPIGDGQQMQALGGYAARPSIAILPFQTLDATDERYFGDGIVDDIIQALSGLKELFVIAKGSTRKYRDAAPDLKRIGRELGVHYILHGNVQRSGDQLRIHTFLTDAESGEVLRPNRYQGLMADLFDLQDQIALETAKYIAPYVRERELKRALRKHPQSMTAYDLVLQALGPLHDLDYTAFTRAQTLLQRAAELDPTYAPAYSYAAHWHCYRIGQEWSADVAADAREAERLADIAIKLDTNDATAMAVRAHVHCIARRDYAASRAGFERALSTSPNLAYAWALSSVTESCAGHGAVAVTHARAALRLSPDDNFAHFNYSALAQGYFVNGRIDDAVQCGVLARARNNNFTGNLRILGAALVEAGQFDDAREVVAQHMLVVPGFALGAWLKRTWLCDHVRNKVAANLKQAGMPE